MADTAMVLAFLGIAGPDPGACRLYPLARPAVADDRAALRRELEREVNVGIGGWVDHLSSEMHHHRGMLRQASRYFQ